MNALDLRVKAPSDLRFSGRLRAAQFDVGDFDNHVVFQNRDRYLSELSSRVSGMDAGPNIELVSVPGADYMHLGLREHHAFARLVLGTELLDLGDHLTLPGR